MADPHTPQTSSRERSDDVWTRKKSPALRRDLPAPHLVPRSELAVALALILALTVRFLALTIGVLLLLSGLLAAALLLTGLLIRFLVLLARLLVGVGHRDLPG